MLERDGKYISIGDPYQYLFIIGDKYHLINCDDNIFSKELAQKSILDPFLRLTVFERLSYRNKALHLMILNQCQKQLVANFGFHSFELFEKLLLDRKFQSASEYVSSIKPARFQGEAVFYQSRIESKDHLNTYIKPIRNSKENSVRELRSKLNNILEKDSSSQKNRELLGFSLKILESAEVEVYSTYASFVLRYLKVLKKEFSFLPINNLSRVLNLDEKFIEHLIFSICINLVAYPERKAVYGGVVFDLMQSRYSSKVRGNFLYLMEKSHSKDAFQERIYALFEEAWTQGDHEFCRQLFKKVK